MTPLPDGTETLGNTPYDGQFFDKGGAVYNVMHPDFGAKGDAANDDGVAWNLAVTGMPAAGGVILVPQGAYLLTTAFSFAAKDDITLLLMPGVVLTGSALPGTSGDNVIWDLRDGGFVWSGPGPHGIGGAAVDYLAMNMGGAFTSLGASTRAVGLHLSYDLTGGAGDTAILAHFMAGAGTGGTLTTQTATENIAVTATAHFGEPNITDNLTGDLTIAATVYISGAPTEGEVNAALYVVSGDVIFAGTTSLFIGDTINANMTTGITINQGAADNEILAFKSSDVAHSGTAFTEADTFATFAKKSATGGGLSIIGFSDTEATTGNSSLELAGFTEDTALDTTKTTSGLAAIVMRAGIVSGTTFTAPGADENLLVIRAFSTTRFIFDTEGSGHADVEFTTFDKHDDIAILDDLEALMVPKIFGEAVHYDAEFFAREGLMNDIREENGKTRGMMNYTRMIMLSVGACRQLGAQNRAFRLELNSLKSELNLLRNPDAQVN